MNEVEYHLKNCGDRGGSDNTLRDLHNSSDNTKADFHIMVYHSFQIIPSLKTGLNMLTYIEVKLFFDSACLAASLGEKELLFCKYSPVELSSCLQHFVYFFLVTLVKCATILYSRSLPKQLSLVARSSRLTAQ